MKCTYYIALIQYCASLIKYLIVKIYSAHSGSHNVYVMGVNDTQSGVFSLKVLPLCTG